MDGSGTTVGTGFLVSADGLIATCAHVIVEAGAGPGGQVAIAFAALEEAPTAGNTQGPSNTKSPTLARVEKQYWWSPESLDIALLRVEGGLPSEVRPVELAPAAGTWGTTVHSLGFPKAVRAQGWLLGQGHLVGAVQRGQTSLLQIRSSELTIGFSGAPLLDERQQRVIGMVDSILAPDEYSKLRDVAFATPTETLISICAEMRASSVEPYRALASFSEEDRRFYFGRERLLQRVADSLGRQPRHLVLLGPSGSGKSSLLQAGLIPLLREGSWPGGTPMRVFIARPRSDPFAELARAGLTWEGSGLPAVLERALAQDPQWRWAALIIDQFEELLTSCPPEVRQRFVRELTALLRSPAPVSLILAMRSDFYGVLAEEAPTLLETVEDGLRNVFLRIDAGELASVIRRPALEVGLRISDEVVKDIVEDALKAAPFTEGSEPAARSTVLPLLEFALSRLWEHDHRSGELTLHGYHAIGKVGAALTQWAEQAFRELEQRGLGEVAEHVLIELVFVGDQDKGLPDARVRRLRRDLFPSGLPSQKVDEVIWLLTERRLLVTDVMEGKEPTVEIIHDALLRDWERLQRWIRSNATFLLWRQGLRGRLSTWEKTAPDDVEKRDRELLLRGAELTHAEDWFERRGLALGEAERDFIRRSIEQRKTEARNRENALRQQQESERRAREAAEARARAEEDARKAIEARAALELKEAAARETAAQATMRSRKLTIRSLAGVISMLLLVGAYLWYESALRTKEELARRLAAQAQVMLTDRAPEGALLALESARLVPSSEANTVMLKALSVLPTTVSRFKDNGGAVGLIAFSPDGKYIATTAGVEMRDAEAYLTTKGLFRNDVLVSETSTGAVIGRVTHDKALQVAAMMFSQDGKWLVTGNASGEIHIAQFPTLQIVKTFKQANVSELAFSSDGLFLLMAGSSEAVLARVKDWQEVTRYINANDLKLLGPPLAFSTAGEDEGWTLGLAAFDAKRWWQDTGQALAARAHETVHRYVISPKGQWVASWGEDGIVRVWDVRTETQRWQLPVASVVRSLAFSPDGRWLAVVPASGHVQVLDSSDGQEVLQPHHFDGKQMQGVAFSPDGRFVATGDRDGNVQVWDARTDIPINLPHEYKVTRAQMSQDDALLLTMTDSFTQEKEDGGVGDLVQELSLWRTSSGQRLIWWEVLVDTRAVLSPSGRSFAMEEVYEARLHDLDAGSQITIASEHFIRDLAYSPDEMRLVFAGGSLVDSLLTGKDAGGVIRVVGTVDGKEQASLWTDAGVARVQFAEDGGVVLAKLDNGDLCRWSPTEPGALPDCTGTGRSEVLVDLSGQYLSTSDLQELVDDWGISEELPGYGPHVTDGGTAGVVLAFDRMRQVRVMRGKDLARAETDDSGNGFNISHDGKEVTSASISRDARFIASGGYDKLIRLWDVASGRELEQFPHRLDVGGVLISPTGRHVVGIEDRVARRSDGTSYPVQGPRSVRIWRGFLPEELPTEVCDRVLGKLTPQERQQYLERLDVPSPCPGLEVAGSPAATGESSREQRAVSGESK